MTAHLPDASPSPPADEAPVPRTPPFFPQALRSEEVDPSKPLPEAQPGSPVAQARALLTSQFAKPSTSTRPLGRPSELPCG